METASSVALGALIESCSTVKHISDFVFDYDIELDYEDWDDEKLIIKDTHSKVLVCHRAVINNFMMSKEWMKSNNVDFYNINERGLDKYGLILCGHFHKQYGISKNGKTVLNPGCFTRRNANEIEIHSPSYYIVDLDTFANKLFAIPNTKETSEVISSSHLTYSRMAKNIKGEILEFFKKIKFSKDKNQFFRSLMEVFNNLDEGSFKETMRELLIITYGSKVKSGELDGTRRFSKVKKYALKGGSKE